MEETNVTNTEIKYSAAILAVCFSLSICYVVLKLNNTNTKKCSYKSHLSKTSEDCFSIDVSDFYEKGINILTVCKDCGETLFQSTLNKDKYTYLAHPKIAPMMERDIDKHIYNLGFQNGRSFSYTESDRVSTLITSWTFGLDTEELPNNWPFVEDYDMIFSGIRSRKGRMILVDSTGKTYKDVSFFVPYGGAIILQGDNDFGK